MRTGLWVLVTVIVHAALLAPASVAQAGGAERVSEFAFKMETGSVGIVVDTEAASFKSQEKYIPLVVLVGARGTDTLNVNRASFALTDPAGRFHPLATAAEIEDKRNYGSPKVAEDYACIAKTLKTGTARAVFAGLAFQEGTCFFVNASGIPGVLRDKVQLRPDSFTWVLLYFANPAGRAAGTYRLTFTDSTSAITVSVPFEIRWK
jgi:hypothetical protein